MMDAIKLDKQTKAVVRFAEAHEYRPELRDGQLYFVGEDTEYRYPGMVKIMKEIEAEEGSLARDKCSSEQFEDEALDKEV